MVYLQFLILYTVILVQIDESRHSLTRKSLSYTDRHWGKWPVFIKKTERDRHKLFEVQILWNFTVETVRGDIIYAARVTLAWRDKFFLCFQKSFTDHIAVNQRCSKEQFLSSTHFSTGRSIYFFQRWKELLSNFELQSLKEGKLSWHETLKDYVTIIFGDSKTIGNILKRSQPRGDQAR